MPLIQSAPDFKMLALLGGPRAQTWLRDGPKMSPKRTPDGPKMAPRWSPKAPRWFQKAPRWSQEAPRCPRRLKEAPRWPQDAPRWSQDGPSWAPRGPLLGLLLASIGAPDPSRAGGRKIMLHSASAEALSGPLGVESRGHADNDKYRNSYENHRFLYNFVHSRFRALETRGRLKRGPFGPCREPSWGLLGVSWGL